MRLLEKLSEYLTDYFKGSCVSIKSSLYSRIGSMIPFADMRVTSKDDSTDIVRFDFGSVLCTFHFKWDKASIYTNMKLVDITPIVEELNIKTEEVHEQVFENDAQGAHEN